MNLATLTPRKKGDPPLPGAGRPKGAPNMKTILAKMLSMKEDFTNPISKKRGKASQLEIILWKQLQAARNGNLAAFNAIVDRFEGKADQKLAIDSSGPIQFIYNEAPGNDPVIDD